jgi:glycosyltransferase involved in cell wall biosynthesis
MHVEALRAAMEEAGHEVDVLQVPFKWYPPSELVHQMGLWRSLDLAEANGEPIDAVIALKFPAYLVPHERKIVWLIHQHRPAYDLWDDPKLGDLASYGDGPAVRDMIWDADRVALGEAKRVFTNSANVRNRLRRYLGIPAEVLYHRSPMCQRLLDGDPGEPGRYVLFPSRLDPLKRQDLAVDAMRHVRGPAELVIVGSGPSGEDLRRRIASAGLQDRVRVESGVSDRHLEDLYRGALAVLYPPYDEDYGYVALEAMAAGRPVITTTDAGGPLELVEDGVTGLVAAPDPRELGAAIDRLASDPELVRELGTAGRGRLLDRVPEWPEVVARLLG